MNENNKLDVKKGDIIYCLDLSYAHLVGTKYEESIDMPLTEEMIYLITAPKGKKAIVEKEPYEDTITFLGEEMTYLFIDAYVEELDIHISLVANYPSSQSKSLEEYEQEMKKCLHIDDDYYDFEDFQDIIY